MKVGMCGSRWDAFFFLVVKPPVSPLPRLGHRRSGERRPAAARPARGRCGAIDGGRPTKKLDAGAADAVGLLDEADVGVFTPRRAAADGGAARGLWSSGALELWRPLR